MRFRHSARRGVLLLLMALGMSVAASLTHSRVDEPAASFDEPAASFDAPSGIFD